MGIDDYDCTEEEEFEDILSIDEAEFFEDANAFYIEEEEDPPFEIEFE